MHRDRDVTLGKDRYTKRLDHAPRNIFTLLGATRTLPGRIATSPTGAIEMILDDRDGALRFPTGETPVFIESRRKCLTSCDPSFMDKASARAFFVPKCRSGPLAGG